MELKNLETFVQVAESGGFTKAAQKLGYTQSTVSFQIRQLEEELGLPLFERFNHTVKLTTKGREILDMAHQMIQMASDIRKTAGDPQSLKGTIRIAMAASLSNWLFGHSFKTFHYQYPDISLSVTATSTEEMFRLLNQNEVDLVYTLDKHIYHHSYIIATEEPVKTHFIASPENPLARKKVLTLADVVTQPIILTEKNMSYRTLLEEALASQSLEVTPFLEIGDTELICMLIEQNMGISFLPDYVTETAVKNGRLIRLPVTDIHIEVWKQLLYHRDKWISSEMQSVIHYLSQAFPF